jgi:hypothetical protein
MPEFWVEFDLETMEPNAIGEFLRDLFFKKPADGSWSYGCYTTFEVRDDAVPASPKLIRSFFEEEWEEELSFYGYLLRLQSVRIGCFWYWDGDGDLSFVLADNEGMFRIIRNTDCKKAGNWEDYKGWE